MGLVGLSIVGTFVWDRLVTMIFAPDIFKAMIDEAKKTTAADVKPIALTALKVAGGLFVLATGNIILLLGIGYYFYGRKKPDQ